MDGIVCPPHLVVAVYKGASLACIDELKIYDIQIKE
jgi:hypothetical protein